MVCGRSSMVERQLPNLFQALFTTSPETQQNR
jgi:hypothetical protein